MLESLARAAAAGLEWVDPLHTSTVGFDKQAFRLAHRIGTGVSGLFHQPEK
ncbi:hypothetical protein [Microbacterium enclense]|uniref:hypothetical protein n=1 Tax=Microbacterium enclense TaxID=993073 RepID=UPI003F7F602A